MTMRSIIIDKDRDTTSGSLIVCRKSMEGSVISDGNVICFFLDVFLEDKEQQVHNP